VNAILAIAGNTAKEAARKRILQISLVATFILLLALGYLAKGVLEEIKTGGLVDATQLIGGMRVISLFGVVITLFVAMGAIPTEIERRTAHTILARPIDRWQFVVGKFLGIAFVVALNLVVMAVVAVATFWGRSAQIAAYMAKDMGLLLLSLVCLESLVIVFSTFSSQSVAALLAFAVYELGKQPRWVGALADLPGLTFALKWPLKAIYHALPKVNWLSYEQPFIMIREEPRGVALVSVYIVVMLALACLIFRRKDL
jgi:ABC-type transport system involved in multi-copper enzyme maturation permease subunit